MIRLRKKKIGNKKISLYLDYYFEGQRKYEFLKMYLEKDSPQNKETLRLAESVRAKREIEARSAQYGFIPEFKSKVNFIDYLNSVAKEKSYSSRSLTRSCVNWIKKFDKGTKNVSAIDENWLKSFESFMIGKVRENSVVNYLNVLKIGFNTAVKEKIIPTSPFTYYKTRTKKTEGNKQYLTFEEVVKLSETECKKEEIKRAFLFTCFSGMRISDIRRLTWSNVDKDSLTFIQQKTGKKLILPLSETAKYLLHQKTNNVIELNNERVFTLPATQSIHDCIKDWMKRAGIEKHITTHCGRHTFATLSITQGVDLYTISKLLGHTNTNMTQLYAKIIDQKKIDAVNKLPQLKIA